jgi:peptide/nickel transport system permease protein
MAGFLLVVIQCRFEMRFVLTRVLQMLLVLWVVGTLAFIAVHLVGDPVELLIPENAIEAERVSIRAELGLDRPLLERYALFLANALRGDLGQSFYTNKPAVTLLLERFPATLGLVLLALSIAIAVSVPLGVSSASRAGSSFDRAVMSFAAVASAAPTFWTGLLLIYVFVVQWRLLPSQGAGTVAHLILPAVTMSLGRIASLTRFLRSSLLDVLSEDYMRTARAKGLSERVVVYKHALRNALTPLVTMIALQFSGLLTGAVIVESLFAYPGMNRIALDALNRLDYPVMLAFILLSAIFLSIANLAADVLISRIDPRVRYE